MTRTLEVMNKRKRKRHEPKYKGVANKVDVSKAGGNKEVNMEMANNHLQKQARTRNKTRKHTSQKSLQSSQSLYKLSKKRGKKQRSKKTMMDHLDYHYKGFLTTNPPQHIGRCLRLRRIIRLYLHYMSFDNWTHQLWRFRYREQRHNSILENIQLQQKRTLLLYMHEDRIQLSYQRWEFDLVSKQEYVRLMLDQNDIPLVCNLKSRYHRQQGMWYLGIRIRCHCHHKIHFCFQYMGMSNQTLLFVARLQKHRKSICHNCEEVSNCCINDVGLLVLLQNEV